MPAVIRGALIDGEIPPPPALLQPPPPPPILIPSPSPEVIAAADKAGIAAGAAITEILAGGTAAEAAAAAEAAGATPDVVAGIAATGIPGTRNIDLSTGAGEDQSTGDPFLDSLDVPDSFEAGPPVDEVAELALMEEGDAVEAGAPVLLSADHPAPGTIIGTPYQGTHGKAFNKEGGSDNWQSENADDVWLYPGTAITAVEAGTISPGGYGYGLSASGGRFAGWRLHLVSSKGRVFFYTHMRQLVVPKGAKVAAGEVIGYSGVANGVSHLHFAVTPPFEPGSFVKLAYNLKNRSKVIPAPVGAGPPTTAPAGVLATWHAFIKVLSTNLPAAHDKLKANADSLQGVFK